MNRTEQALVNMGFDLRNVRDGLRMHGNDPKRTLEWLSDLTLDAETGGGSNGATKKRPRMRVEGQGSSAVGQGLPDDDDRPETRGRGKSRRKHVLNARLRLNHIIRGGQIIVRGCCRLPASVRGGHVLAFFLGLLFMRHLLHPLGAHPLEKHFSLLASGFRGLGDAGFGFADDDGAEDIEEEEEEEGEREGDVDVDNDNDKNVPLPRKHDDEEEELGWTVPVLDAATLNLSTFWEYTVQSRPALLRGATHLSPARRCWTDAYLAHALNDRFVKVEHSNSGRFANWLERREWHAKQRKATKFLETYQKEENVGKMYIAELKIPEKLKTDIVQPPFSTFMKPQKTLLWLGTKVESLPHTDFNENILMMVDGCKVVRLVHPLERAYVYTRGDSWSQSFPWIWRAQNPPNYSPVDFFDPDLWRFPRFRRAHVMEIKFCAPDALYIPAFWFHHVKSMTSESKEDWKGHYSAANSATQKAPEAVSASSTETTLDSQNQQGGGSECAYGAIPEASDPEGAAGSSSSKDLSREFGGRSLAINMWFPTHSSILDMVLSCVEDQTC